MKENALLEDLRNGKPLSFRKQLLLVISLAFPAIIAQLTSVVMQYIDAAMVGRLGAQKAASIGLMSSTTWLVGGLYSALSMGYYVQVAHRIGAGEEKKARQIVRHGLVIELMFSAILLLVGLLVVRHLPIWLGGQGQIAVDSTRYISVYALGLPFLVLSYGAGGMLQSSGAMKTASFINILMCVLDVIFNYFLIFPTREVSLSGIRLTMPGAGLDVMGASMGTVLSEVFGSLLMLYFLLIKSPMLHIRRDDIEGSGTPDLFGADFKKAITLAAPVALEQFIMGSAQVVITRIVAPLGAISIAANSFAITAESFCYMPGFGIAYAGTTLIGQSIGAGRQRLAARFGWLVTFLGMILMGLAGVLLYAFSPQLMSILSPDPDIIAMGTTVLRIEAFAEPLFGAALVIAGVFRGSGDSLRPSVTNLISMWLIRIPLAIFLSTRIGLPGVWIAMCTELCCRGTLLLIMLGLWGRKLKKSSSD